MYRGSLEVVLRHLRRATAPEDGVRPDAELLERFVRLHDEAAFELLMHRHGPMVLSTCRRVLRQTQSAEDAFQATFLLLARKASSIGKREALAGWLYRVAYRVALRARKREARQPEVLLDDAVPSVGAEAGLAEHDLRPVLDAELRQLPAKYRDVVILCYLEGRTYAETARQLGCPRGTVAIRLRRARELLRVRLTRRGLALSAPVLLAALTQTAAAKVPAALALAALRLAIHSALLSSAVALAEGVLRDMFLTKLKVIAALVLLIGLAGVGAVLFSQAREPGPHGRGRHAAERREPDRRDLIRVPSERDGVLLFVGTEIGKGEKVEADRQITVSVGGEKKTYRLLREGDRIQEGQLLARVNDRLARDEVAIKQAKLEAAEADRRASGKTRDEAEKRYQAMLRTRMQQHGVITDDELRAAKLTWDRYVEEERAKRALVAQARAELSAAETIVKQHEIRSPVTGVLTKIYAHKGEAVRALETVFLIRVDREEDAGRKTKGRASQEVPSEKGGRLVLVGTEIKPGEKVAPEQTVELERGFLAILVEGSYRRVRPEDPLNPGKVTVVRQKVRYRKLQVGDPVMKGQLLAVVNDALAIDEVSIKVARLDAAEADYRAAIKIRDEAEKRYTAVVKAISRKPGSFSEEERCDAKRIWERYTEEARAKLAAISVAQRELRAALTHLQMHEIRSDLNGRLTTLYKHQGEAVKALEAVARIESDEAR